MYCPARKHMTLETFTIKLHFHSFSWLLSTFGLETRVFIRWRGMEKFLCQVSKKCWLWDDSLPPAHINHAFGQTLLWTLKGGSGGKRARISLQDADKMAACASTCTPLWLNAIYLYIRRGCNQSAALLAGNSADTLALTLARVLSAGGPPFLASLTDIFSLSTIVCHNLQDFADTTFLTPGRG